jgi:methionyl-tRNA synthetase
MTNRLYSPSVDLIKALRRCEYNFKGTARSCTSYQQARKRFSSTSIIPRSEKPYYVTTPIFYVNASPHIGHLYTIVLSDIFKRWQLLNGRTALLCTGTDEHGMKIQQAAAKEGIDVRTFCDRNYKSFQVLAERADVQYDHFIRTCETEHRFAVQHFWLMLKQRGWVYASKHEGWYSVSDETFYPAGAVQLVLDPSTGRKHMASMETGKEVEWTEEENYHFRLSAFRDRLLEFYAKNPKFVVPETRMREVIRQVDEGLEDLSISRPVERLSWGIPVPDDESQTIYVWLDALINYLTKANYPFQIPGEEDAGGWPADVQVIGKDIVRFHCIYWPAFLMALDLPPPKQVLSHAHWTLGQQKMSKSVGNVVNPFFAIDRFETDVMRYYLAHDGGIKDDSSYDNRHIAERYKKGLQDSLGNLVSRITRGKSWNVHEAVKSVANGGAPAAGELAEKQRRALMKLPERVTMHMANLDISAALKCTMQVIYDVRPLLPFPFPFPFPSHYPQTNTTPDKCLHASLIPLVSRLRQRRG